MRYGFDFLAGNKYRSVVRDSKSRVIGMFLEAFGPALAFTEELAKTKKMDVFRAQGVWSDSHTFGEKETRRAVSLAQKLNAIAKKYPKIEWYYSPFCEHKLKKDKMLKVMRDVAKVAPLLTLVNTPMNEGDFLDGYINETHGIKGRKPKGKYFFAFDGQACVDADVEAAKKKFANCTYFFWWDAPFNLKIEPDDTTPRPERKHKPYQKLIESIAYLETARGAVKLPAKWLVKSHAETHPNPDPRADKLLIISPVKNKKIELRANGMLIAELSYYGPYAGGGHRYYSKLMGYEISILALKKSGSPICDVVIDGKVYGKINPAFRQGTFR